MGKKLFGKQEEKQRAKRTLQTFRGQIVDYSDKDVRWIVTKLKTIRNNAPVMIACMIREADDEYLYRTQAIRSRQGVSSLVFNDIVTGKVSSRYVEDNKGAAIDALSEIERAHQRTMSQINVFFKINSYLRELSNNLFADLTLSKDQFKAFTQLQCLLSEKQYKSVGELLLDASDNVQFIKDTIGSDEKSVQNALYYRQKQAKIRFIDLSDAEIDFILEQDYICETMLLTVREVLSYYFEGIDRVKVGKTFCFADVNRKLWELWERHGSDIGVFTADNYRYRPMSYFGKFRGYCL